MTSTFFRSPTTAPGAGAPLPSPTPLCSGQLPLVLLPVRLETRFFPAADGGAELRVRIYPDKIHADTHEPALTTNELEAAVRYWEQDWRAGPEKPGRLAAWHSLATRFTPQRAAWIVRATTPTNSDQRPTKAIPAGQSLSPAPALPALGSGAAGSWTRAPRAALLPDRWMAVVQVQGQPPLAATGRDVLRPLAVGPDPAASGALPPADQLALDPAMRWMVDFDAALACGMALRIPVTAAALAAGLDSLVVYGVAASLAPGDAAAGLADLLEAHQYTDGLAFLDLGTSTNNTEEQRAGGDADDPDHTLSFERTVMADPARAPNAARTGQLLGLAPTRAATALGRLAQAQSDHDGNARAMNTALWSVGWGYFLGSLAGAHTGVPLSMLDWLREHHRQFVRGGGPLPPLRVGSQPYGLLPVTSLDLWAASASEADAASQRQLRDFLLLLRDQVWRPVAGQVPRVGLRQSPPDPDADLADLMRMDGVSQKPLLRSALGRPVLESLHRLAARDFAPSAQAQQARAAELVQRLNLPPTLATEAAVLQLYFSPASREIVAPLVQVGEEARGQRLEPDFIAALLAAPRLQDLIDARPGPGTSLLQALLRHALLREHAVAAARIVATLPGQDIGRLLRDAQLIDMVDVPVVDFQLGEPLRTLHWRRQLDMRVPAVTGDATVRDFIAAHLNDRIPALAGLQECREALAHLRTLDSAQLALLTSLSLDLASHRLDAWITSLATRRLTAMTSGATAGAGLVVGGYGWVENLRPADTPAAVPDAALPAGEPGPLQRQAADSGFIHAPSATHATAAAVLRNAHLGAQGQPSADDPFAIELSSRRARRAAALLDGVRQGQPLGALLGYRLERQLHELQLDRFIEGLRRAAPLAPAAGAMPSRHGVDGLKLLQCRQDPADPALTEALKDATPLEQQRVKEALDALEDAVDGLGDALSAEAAYQLARGNTTRLSSTLAAVARGETPPPELEVLGTPRSGVSTTHRALVLMAGGPQTAPGWLSSASSTLAGSERMLNAWASRLLGDARKVRCTVELIDAASGLVRDTQRFPLAELPLAPLDFVHAAAPEGEATADAEAGCLAEQWVLYHARRRAGSFAEPSVVRLQHERPADLGTGEITLFDALEQARAVRATLEGARSLRPDDLGPADRDVQAVLDLAELDARVGRGDRLLTAAHRTLATLLAAGPTSTAEALRSALMALSCFGLQSCVPCQATGDAPEHRAALMKQGSAALVQAKARLDRHAALRAQSAAAGDRGRCDQLLARGRALFGERFLMLPLFTLGTADANELKSALAGSMALQGGDALQAHEWWARMARVRAPLARLAGCLAGAEALAAGDRLSLAVAQLPFQAADRWVGLRPLAGVPLPAGKLSLAVQGAPGLNPTLPLCGLLIDEWMEVIPQAEETTAIAFQFNPPNACAPQAILLAVPPVANQDWTTETLRRVLLETLDLAKLRAVDPALLGDFAQLLPALVLPFNPEDDTPSTDLSPLAG